MQENEPAAQSAAMLNKGLIWTTLFNLFLKPEPIFYLSITSITTSELKLQETTVLKVPVYLTVPYTGSYLVFHVYHNTNTTLKQKM